jgi:hypothetical protein
VTSKSVPFCVTVQEAEGAGAEKTTTSSVVAAAGAYPGAVGAISEQAAHVTTAPAAITTRDNRIISTSHEEDYACSGRPPDRSRTSYTYEE